MHADPLTMHSADEVEHRGPDGVVHDRQLSSRNLLLTEQASQVVRIRTFPVLFTDS